VLTAAKPELSKRSGKAIAEVAASEVADLSSETAWSQAIMVRLGVYCRDLSCAKIEQGDHFSGLFISWCIRHAGFSEKEFPLFLAHRDYIRRGFRDVKFVFKAMPFHTTRPTRGDIVSFSREGQLSFSRLVHTSMSYKLESTICLKADRTGFNGAIGNWPEGKIDNYALETDKNGFLKQRDKFPLVSILRLRSDLE
jgi:hypothetical protein